MTDEPDLSPEQDAALRRLLGEARHTDPMPADVAARLDDVLRGLATQPTSTQSTSTESTAPSGAADAPAEVVELALRRRRASRLLVAAAAIVAVGIGGGRLLVDPTDRPTSAADTAADATSGAAMDVPAPEAAGRSGLADEDTSSGQAAAPEDSGGDELPYDGTTGLEASGDPGDPMAPGAPGVPEADTARIGGPVPLTVRLTERRFARQVARLTDPAGVRALDGERLDGAALSTDPEFVCDAASWGAGLLVPVLYAERPAVLAFRAPSGDTQVVDLLQCGTGDVVRSIVVATVG